VFRAVFIHIERGAHGVLTKNKISAKIFTNGRTTTYRKKSLVVGVPFSHGARTFAPYMEGCLASPLKVSSPWPLLRARELGCCVL
jgi:hypothetical protein